MRFEYSAGGFVYRKTSNNVLLLFLVSENNELDIPKGHIEKNERTEETAKREIKEETGLDVDFVPYFKEHTEYFFYRGKERTFKRVVFFLAKTNRRDVRVSYEHSGYKWLNFEEAMSKVKYKDIKILLPEVFDYIDRYERMNRLNGDYTALSKTVKNWHLSTNFVPGEGPLNAKIMVVGQAPGRNEDQQRKPFVGRSGLVLNEMLKVAKLKRDRLYITSVVQYYPPKNRTPSREEVGVCKEFLMKQIDVIKPMNIVMLGDVACNSLIGGVKVSRDHGRVMRRDGVKYLITFHPAMALRSKNKVAVLMKNDFAKFKDELNVK
jgi:DNA polymerase